MKRFLVALCLSGLSTAVYAHAPLLNCERQNAQVVCQGGFSDGSSAFGVQIDVKNYDEKTLFSGKLDESGKIAFDIPKDEEFFVRFDAGPGHILELDHADIQ
ncbi:hypothetical protein RP300_01926 [Oligella urethralis]|uniref:hypothetical protein n=1 Tax=Oligella TaxID=90243 RepID=UPI000661590C|nr:MULTISPECIES: hypothetical protein [Oligella]OFV46440.1 hypothetical protein HMPREF3179_09995 [Oligella sp. HMSC09E12]PMC17341.1 hypothetical protein CJ230_06220 [Oligella urethralis]WOS38357.1 hypothetical protein RP300_01926 [Oligella urethralis]